MQWVGLGSFYWDVHLLVLGSDITAELIIPSYLNQYLTDEINDHLKSHQLSRPVIPHHLVP